MTVLFLLKRKGAFIPHGISSVETFESLTGSEYRARIDAPRNIKYHRQFFAFLKEIYKHQEKFDSFDAFRAAVMVALGEFNVVQVDDKEIAIPHSLSFDSMDQTKFEEFRERAVEMMLTRVLPKLDAPEVRERCLEILKGSES